MDTDFYSAAEFAKKIERNAAEHSEFKGKVEIIHAVDLYPDEYIDFNFSDLVNLYERSQKIISAAKFGIYAPASREEKKIVEKAVAEVEEKVKGITTERLEEMKVAEVPKPEELQLEFERHMVDEEHKEERLGITEKEEKKEEKKEEEIQFGSIEMEEKKPEKIQEEKKQPVSVIPAAPSPPVSLPKSVIMEKVIQQKAVPEVLKAPEQPAEDFADIEEYFRREWGGAVDEMKVKKKMLELTKDLFKEKTTSKRERIKFEIVVLKNMLAKAGEKERPKARAAPKEAAKEFAANMFDTILSTQATDLSSAKDLLLSSYRGKMDELKKNFYEKLKGVSEDDAEKRKSIYEDFTMQLVAVGQALPGDISKSKAAIMQKHIGEMENLKKSVQQDVVQLKKVEQRMVEINNYGEQFDSVSSILTKNIEALIETAGSEVMPKEKKEMEVSSLVYEINETDEGTLLYYLHSTNPELYKKYERNRISKQEAIHYARILMAKEKGLSQGAIKKYFGELNI